MDGMNAHKIKVNSEVSIKEKISLALFDKENPEMITYLYDKEIGKIAALETVIDKENIIRKKLGVPNNIYTKYIKSIKVHRTSRNGWRSEQGVQVIGSNIEDESSSSKMGGLRSMFK